jgi:hypothetical protein
MNVKPILKLCCISLFLLASCEKDEGVCFDSRGDQLAETRLLEHFSSLSLENRMDVFLIPDTANFVELVYGEKLLNGIETRIENDVLYIKDNNKCAWMREVRPLPSIHVHCTALKHIYSQNAGTLQSIAPLTGDSLYIEVEDASGTIALKVKCQSLSLIVHTGATDIDITGQTDYLYIYNSGYAPVYANDLYAETVSVHNNSTGDTYVFANNHLYYQIYHRGNIMLSGPAATTKWRQVGGGQLIKN